MYIGLLGVITLEIIIVARYWTWLWGAAVIGSYLVVFPFVMLYPRVQVIFGIVDPSWWVGVYWMVEDTLCMRVGDVCGRCVCLGFT